MTRSTGRRHIGHYEIPGGTAHITWRLHRRHPPLSEAEKSEILAVIRRDDDLRCRIDAGVIMDDHVHLLVSATFGTPAAKLVHSWKSITAHRLTKRFHRPAPIWQAEYYQRWIFSPALISICANYIHQNPHRKWPGIENYAWVLP